MKKVGLVTFIVVIALSGLLAACSSGQKTVGDLSGTEDVARPSTGGGPGEAVNLKGDVNAGTQVYQQNCAICHGEQGKGGVDNPGAKDVTVPPLNPIDTSLKSSDYKTFATNIDLFIEHGSQPEGDNPSKPMRAFGDEKILAPQQIADTIAYVISLNK